MLMKLMHMDIPVADVNVDNGVIYDVYNVINRKHYPLGAYTEHAHLRGRFLDSWSHTRSIPRERQDAEQIERKIGCSFDEAAFKNLGVSLTDCYWFSNNPSLTWNDVNYHVNGFSHSFARHISLGSDDEIDFHTPDFTTNGVLKKFWISLDGVPTLVKYGNYGDKADGKNLLCANEIIASKVASLMNVEHITNFPLKIGQAGEPVSASSCFITNPNEEFVSGLQIEKESKCGFGAAFYNHLCQKGYRDFVDHMIVFDTLVANTDRHDGNFGFIRDPNTLEILRPAPLFDSGSCLGWNGGYVLSQCCAKPFGDRFADQLALVSNFPDYIPGFMELARIIKEEFEQFDISHDHFRDVQRELCDSINLLHAAKEKHHSLDLDGECR